MILETSTLDGSAYGLEMLLLAVIMRVRMVQVPVNYHPRVGVSSVTGDFGKTISLGLEMIGLDVRMRVRRRRIAKGELSPHPTRTGYRWPRGLSVSAVVRMTSQRRVIRTAALLHP